MPFIHVFKLSNFILYSPKSNYKFVSEDFTYCTDATSPVLKPSQEELSKYWGEKEETVKIYLLYQDTSPGLCQQM